MLLLFLLQFLLNLTHTTQYIISTDINGQKLVCIETDNSLVNNNNNIIKIMYKDGQKYICKKIPKKKLPEKEEKEAMHAEFTFPIQPIMENVFLLETKQNIDKLYNNKNATAKVANKKQQLLSELKELLLNLEQKLNNTYDDNYSEEENSVMFPAATTTSSTTPQPQSTSTVTTAASWNEILPTTEFKPEKNANYISTVEETKKPIEQNLSSKKFISQSYEEDLARATTANRKYYESMLRSKHEKITAMLKSLNMSKPLQLGEISTNDDGFRAEIQQPSTTKSTITIGSTEKSDNRDNLKKQSTKKNQSKRKSFRNSEHVKVEIRINNNGGPPGENVKASTIASTTDMSTTIKNINKEEISLPSILLPPNEFQTENGKQVTTAGYNIGHFQGGWPELTTAEPTASTKYPQYYPKQRPPTPSPTTFWNQFHPRNPTPYEQGTTTTTTPSPTASYQLSTSKQPKTPAKRLPLSIRVLTAIGVIMSFFLLLYLDFNVQSEKLIVAHITNNTRDFNINQVITSVKSAGLIMDGNRVTSNGGGSGAIPATPRPSNTGSEIALEEEEREQQELQQRREKKERVSSKLDFVGDILALKTFIDLLVANILELMNNEFKGNSDGGAGSGGGAGGLLQTGVAGVSTLGSNLLGAGGNLLQAGLGGLNGLSNIGRMGESVVVDASSGSSPTALNNRKIKEALGGIENSDTKLAVLLKDRIQQMTGAKGTGNMLNRTVINSLIENLTKKKGSLFDNKKYRADIPQGTNPLTKQSLQGNLLPNLFPQAAIRNRNPSLRVAPHRQGGIFSKHQLLFRSMYEMMRRREEKVREQQRRRRRLMRERLIAACRNNTAVNRRQCPIVTTAMTT